MIYYLCGDIFQSKAQVLVNSVNCCGVMGAGIALEFKKRFPQMYKAYRKACRQGNLDIGRPFLWKSETVWILNFPTKLHFVQPARLPYIEQGLCWIVENYKREGITSMAMPRLGTYLGGLKWEDVRALIEHHLGGLSDLEVTVYEEVLPSGPRRRKQGRVNER